MTLQQGEHHSVVRVRAALKYLVLALSGYMDDVLAAYKVMYASCDIYLPSVCIFFLQMFSALRNPRRSQFNHFYHYIYNIENNS